MPAYEYDLFTIGAGSGGVRASRMAASYGARVAVAEERYLGGTCVNVGCVPKKLMVLAAHFHEEFQHAGGFGWDLGHRRHHWDDLRDRIAAEVARLNQVYADILDRAGVVRREGRARLVAPHTVQVGDQAYTARHILIATGSWPSVPDLPGVEHAITSNEAFSLPHGPDSVVLVGGGYIAVEFAGIFHGLGAQTTLVHRGSQVLRGFDRDIRNALTHELDKKGIDLKLETEVEKIEKIGDGVRVHLSNGEVVEASLILFATGRKPLSADLGLETVGVEVAPDGSVVVDEYSRTTAEGIHAIGDVTDRMNLTPMAIAEGMALANTLFNQVPTKPCYADVPTAVFSQPPVAAVGLTEDEARAAGLEFDLYRSAFRPMKHSLSGSDERTLMKLVVDAHTDRVLGLHMVGLDAAEMVQGFGVALRCGATKAQFDATIGVHPTSAEEFVTMREKA